MPLRLRKTEMDRRNFFTAFIGAAASIAGSVGLLKSAAIPARSIVRYPPILIEFTDIEDQGEIEPLDLCKFERYHFRLNHCETTILPEGWEAIQLT